MTIEAVTQRWVVQLEAVQTPIDSFALLLEFQRDVARDKAEEVFTAACADPNITDAEVCALHDRAAWLMLEAMRETYRQSGLDTPERLRATEVAIAAAFNARMAELCDAGAHLSGGRQ